jgi:hypothetical protein
MADILTQLQTCLDQVPTSLSSLKKLPNQFLILLLNMKSCRS